MICQHGNFVIAIIELTLIFADRLLAS